jgi:ribosome-associated heat shock protein Hsp15
MTEPEAGRQRIDKWLWCARFYKSRSLATAAVEGGRVHLNGARVKPSHPVRPGDRIELTREAESWDLEIRSLPARRGSALAASQCYEESAASVAQRAARRAARKLTGGPAPRPASRPDKRARRQLVRLQRGQ